jgi:hypothetical protein
LSVVARSKGAGIDKIGLEVGAAATAAAAVTLEYGWITIKYNDHHEFMTIMRTNVERKLDVGGKD